LSGWTTATESSAFGVIGGIMVGRFYGNLTIKSLIDSVKEGTHTYVMLMFVVCGAMILANAAGLIGLPRQLVLLVTGLDVPRSAIMVGLIVMYLALGCLFDGISFLVMTLPISGLEFGGIWFGVLMVILIEIGQLTPPVGVNLYVVQAIAGKGTSLEDVVRGILPFFWILLIGAIIVLLFPQIATLLPSTFGFEII
jgi:C4-dicarboxylate transporter DctM subunit